MPTNIDAGIAELPGDGEVHWSREEITPEEAGVLAKEVLGKRFRVTRFTEHPDGRLVLHHLEVEPGWLHTLLYEWEHGVGGRVVSVERIE